MAKLFYQYKGTTLIVIDIETIGRIVDSIKCIQS